MTHGALYNYDTKLAAQYYRSRHISDWNRIAKQYDRDELKMIITALILVFAAAITLILLVTKAPPDFPADVMGWCVFGLLVGVPTLVAIIAVRMKHGDFGCKAFGELYQFICDENLNCKSYIEEH